MQQKKNGKRPLIAHCPENNDDKLGQMVEAIMAPKKKKVLTMN